MDKNYSHTQQESAIYSLWENADAFNPDSRKEKAATDKQPFSIIMPPPNANDPLHIGHAMFISIEDIMIRFHRMKGDDTVWIPGTDHAGIETQFVFEKKLAKQGKSRYNFDRETLYSMIWDYVQENSGVAVDQMKKLGASADWSRFKFTLDSSVVEFVVNTFKKLHDDRLVYRDLRLVNYCWKCGTSYSELEVVHKEQTDKLYYLKYGPFTLATTRPETKFADTAVAVHPKDQRYQQYIGQEIKVQGLNGPFTLKVIADEYVDREFGTGVVKITPYHDFNDYEVWQRHKDEIPMPKQVIGFDGKLTEVAGKYAGMKVKIARDQIEKDLAEKGLLEKVNDQYLHTIGTCYRCGTVLEPLPLPQFFIKVKDEKNNLTKRVLEVLDKTIDEGGTKIYGTGRDKILRNWLENLKDWNISRQIVWGIRIPVWYQVEGNEEKISVVFISNNGEFQKNAPLKERLEEGYTLEEIKKGLQQTYASADLSFVVSQTDPSTHHPTSVNYIAETDTFDTWFSSGQWPVVTLKTNKAGDFKRFFPTSVMETGYDILPFWVMRMMLLGIYLEGQTPFRHVYLHGLVRDEKGQKMSKSKGNVINPLEFVDKYGADAVRMALVMSSTPGSDSSVGENKIRGMRNFSNKIWNAVRFYQMEKAAKGSDASADADTATKDEQFTKHLSDVIRQVTRQLDELRIGQAAETVYNEFWHGFCDQAIEDEKNGQLSFMVLEKGLVIFLRLLHPFVPFVTETLWQELWKNGDAQLRELMGSELLITAEWPKMS
jgi:valyl-tRNA synthetase